MFGKKSLIIKELPNNRYYCEYSGTLLLIALQDYNGIMNKFKEMLKKYELASEKCTMAKNAISDMQGKVNKILAGRELGSGDLSDAYIIADSVRGKRPVDIVNTEYPNPPHKKWKTYSRAKIFNALSVRKDRDWARVMSLYNKYPEVFSGISMNQLVSWFIGRTKK